MVLATASMTTREGSKQYVCWSWRSGYLFGRVVLIRSWHGSAFCYSFGRMYMLQNIQKLLLGARKMICSYRIGYEWSHCDFLLVSGLICSIWQLSFPVAAEFCWSQSKITRSTFSLDCMASVLVMFRSLYWPQIGNGRQGTGISTGVEMCSMRWVSRLFL